MVKYRIPSAAAIHRLFNTLLRRSVTLMFLSLSFLSLLVRKVWVVRKMLLVFLLLVKKKKPTLRKRGTNEVNIQMSGRLFCAF